MSTTTPVKTPAIKEPYAEEGLLRLHKLLAGAFHEGGVQSLHAGLHSLCSALARSTPGHAERIDSLLAERAGVAGSLNCDEGIRCAAGRHLIPTWT